MPWRDPSALYPEVDAERSAGSSSPTVSAPLGVDAQADASRAPEFASATSSVAARMAGAPAPLGASATPRRCAWRGGCTRDAVERTTGLCDSHNERFLDRARGITDSIGRGELDS